jgi:hypothetical protein
LAELPHEDYAQFHKGVTQIRHQFLKELAAALQPRLNQHFGELPQTSYAQKQEIAKAVNRDLRLLNLCVRCPATGTSAILVTDFRDHEDRSSRFRFQLNDSAGKQMRKNSSPRMPLLELLECPPREENFVHRSRSSRRGESE